MSLAALNHETVLKELFTLRRAVKRLHLKVERWEDDEYIAVSERGHIGGTLAKDERDAIERANET